MGDDNFWETSIRLRMSRLEIIASNIANADTPDYKARDFDFESVLEDALSKTPLKMATPCSEHIPTARAATEAIPTGYRIPQQPSMVGNTVELETERGAFAENAVRYQFALDRAIDEYKEMLDLFKSLTI